jgi:hypothetical protein
MIFFIHLENGSTIFIQVVKGHKNWTNESPPKVDEPWTLNPKPNLVKQRLKIK